VEMGGKDGRIDLLGGFSGRTGLLAYWFLVCLYCEGRYHRAPCCLENGLLILSFSSGHPTTVETVSR